MTPSYNPVISKVLCTTAFKKSNPSDHLYKRFDMNKWCQVSSHYLDI